MGRKREEGCANPRAGCELILPGTPLHLEQLMEVLSVDLLRGKEAGGVMVRDAAESWRGAPLGLRMASVGGLESEFLAPKVTLGTVRWLLFGLPALFRRTGSSHRG